MTEFKINVKQYKKDAVESVKEYINNKKNVLFSDFRGLSVGKITELRRKFCHKCYHYLYPGINCKVRTNKSTQSVEYECKDCGKVNRYPYIKEKHGKRSNSKN